MIRPVLDQQLRDADLDPHHPDLLRQVEAAADARPADPTLRALVRQVHLVVSADHGLLPRVGDVRRESLLRWDGHTTTWLGTHTPTGRPAMVRVLRPAFAGDPVVVRALARDREALKGVVDELSVQRSPVPALIALLPGPPFRGRGPDGSASVEALCTLVGRSLAGLVAWEAAGLGWSPPLDAELRDAGDHIALCCLTPGDGHDGGPTLAAVAHRIHAWWGGADDHPVADLVHGLSVAPPAAITEAVEHLVPALASHLADQRHQLRQRHDRIDRAHRRVQLEHLLRRLLHLVPPPAGVGAFGVDLDGRVLVVHGDGERLDWQTADDDLVPLYDPDEGLVVPVVRRLLRVRASAPVSPRLNEEVGGDPHYVDRAGQWLSARLTARTLLKLLQAVRPDDAY